MEVIAAALNYLYAIAAMVLNQDTWKQESGRLSWCVKHPCPTLEYLGLIPGPTSHSNFLLMHTLEAALMAVWIESLASGLGMAQPWPLQAFGE